MTGLVLAGGRSRRMGEDKAVLELEGERLVDRAARALAKVCDEVLIASGDGQRLENVAWPQLPDIVPDGGPLAGIIAGLERARTPLLAVVAVDMPFLSPAVFELLASAWQAEGTASPAAIPIVDDHPQPLHAVYATAAAADLRALFDSGARSPAAALARLGATPVPPGRWGPADPSGRFARNLNHPQEFAKLRRSAVAEEPVAYGLESIDPYDQDAPFLWMKLEHLGRYLFAADFLAPARAAASIAEHAGGTRSGALFTVADVACGTGYGLAELRRAADRVIGVDGSPEMLGEARARCPEGDAVRLIRVDLETDRLTESLEPGSLDAVVCFETLEHLVEPERTVAEFAELIRPGGTLICSVPNAAFEARDDAGLPMNREHRTLFALEPLLALLRKHGFEAKYRLGQGWTNALLKRELRLTRNSTLDRRLSDESFLHRPEIVRSLAYLVGYPSPEAFDNSYSFVLVLEKAASPRPGRTARLGETGRTLKLGPPWATSLPPVPG